ncbi:GAF domain-containing SpoIIE family protein phosphatase [Nocardioides solisilvae]|uniref:GAF domain-containing SpoIIE family protein phosphatase n=1 Tax=Nocardioides solisilvae TaxID=1542435 RepID=UPI0013A5A7C0|nr:GAF domain-containing SpoIIE family protein phosphatase [Nocardioides solisilvae]
MSQPSSHRAQETARPAPPARRVLLVAGSHAEQYALDDLTGARCAEAEAAGALERQPELDVVVVGSGAARPVSVVRAVRRAAARVPVVLVVPPAREVQVRYELSCLSTPPRDVTVVTGVDAVRQAVATGLGRGRTARTPLVATLRHPPEPFTPSLDVGALVDQAPVGVVLCAPDGALEAWNRRAAQMLDLTGSSESHRLEDVLAGAVPLLAAPHETGLVVPTLTGRHLDVTGVVTETDAGRRSVLLLLVDVTEQRRAERDRERLSRQVDLLGRISEALVTTLDVEESMGQLAAVLVPEFADWVSVQLTDDLGDLGVVTVRHRDPALQDAVAEVERRQGLHASAGAPSRRVARGEGPLLLRDVDADELERSVEDPVLREHFRSFGLSSLIAVPLPGRDGILGSLVLVRDDSRRTFRRSHLSVAVEAGRRAGIALDNARLYARQHELAGELQRSLLTAPPRVPHGEIAVRYVAAAHEAQVGGDWYDAFAQPDGATVLVVGDVIGHDRRAAAGMSQIRGVLRGIGYTTGEDPGGILVRADEAMAGLGIGAMATALVVRIEPLGDHRPDGLKLAWSSAGHPPMLVLTPEGEVRVLTGDGSPRASADLLLGLDPASPRTVSHAQVPDGSVLLLYSDGLVERRGEDLEDGISRLADTLAFAPEGEGLEALCDRVLDQMLPVEPEDDVAVVAIRLQAPV